MKMSGDGIMDHTKENGPSTPVGTETLRLGIAQEFVTVCYTFFEAGQDLYHESICDDWGKRSGMFEPQGFPVLGRRPQFVRRLPFQHGHAAGHELATTSLIFTQVSLHGI